MINKSFGDYDTFEDWLEATRVSIYDEIKNMSDEEMTAYFHQHAEPVMKQYGLKYSTLRPVQPRKRERITF